MSRDSATADIVARYRASTTSDTAFPIVFKSASHCVVEDLEGNHYIDFISGYGVVSTGWQRPEILAAMETQLRTACFAPPWLPTREAMNLAEQLLACGPKSVQVCARATGGADANEVALKAIAADRGGKVLAIGRAYHGGTTRTLALSDAAAFHLAPPAAPSPPRVPPAYCYRCPWEKSYPGCSLECAQAVEREIKKDSSITGILLEPIIGSGGVIIPPREYFRAIQEICERHHLILIVDEVLTGCGRTGSFLYCNALGLNPSAITVAKGLGGGYVPIGAAMLSQQLADSLARFEDVSATLAWTPLACAATLANLKLIQSENLSENARDKGTKLLASLRELFQRRLPGHTGEIRGEGLMIGIELVKDHQSKEPALQLAKRLMLRCLRSGLMIGTSWDWHCLILMPPLILDDATLNEALDIFDAVLKRMARERDS